MKVELIIIIIIRFLKVWTNDKWVMKVELIIIIIIIIYIKPKSKSLSPCPSH